MSHYQWKPLGPLLGVTDRGLACVTAQLPADATLRALEAHMERKLGVVRPSLGRASEFRDVWRLAEFAKFLGSEGAGGALGSRTAPGSRSD